MSDSGFYQTDVDNLAIADEGKEIWRGSVLELVAFVKQANWMNLPECPTCHGSGYEQMHNVGKWVGKLCPDCKGRGRLLPTEAVEAAADAMLAQARAKDIDGYVTGNHQSAARIAIWAFIDALPGDTNE